MPVQRLGIALALLSIPAAVSVQGQETGFLIVNDLKTGADGRGKVALWMEGSTVAHFRNLRISPAE